MNNKITVLLTALLVVTLAVPVFADGHMEDDVKITGDVKTVFQTGGYGDNVEATTNLWEDGDALDEEMDDDPDLFPARKAFYQEINFNVAAMVNDNITFDLAVDTLANQFIENEAPDAYPAAGHPGDTDDTGAPVDSNDLAMDTALLTISDDVSTIKLGDLGGYHGAVYFVDDEDLEGMELTTAMNGNDIKAFVTGYDDDDDQDFYGVTASRDLEAATVTGKIFQLRNDGEDVSNLAVAVDADVNDTVGVNGELVFSDASDNAVIDSSVAGESDSLIMLGADFKVSDTVTMNAGMESKGEKFSAPYNDLEDGDAGDKYDLFTVGGDMVLDANNSVSGAYTMVDYDTDDNQSTIELALDNTTGEYNNHASLELVTNDSGNDGVDTTVIKLGTEYAMDMATVSAELTNKSGDLNEFNYLTVGYDQQISDNVTWNTSLGYIDGEDVTTGNDGEGTDFETALTVSF